MEGNKIFKPFFLPFSLFNFLKTSYISTPSFIDITISQVKKKNYSAQIKYLHFKIRRVFSNYGNLID